MLSRVVRAFSKSDSEAIRASKLFRVRWKSRSACSIAVLAESRSFPAARRAAAEPASSAAARFRSIWRRKSPFLTRSPSLTRRLTIWPMTRAESSTRFSAWILPFAVTLATMSWVSTFAAMTGTTPRFREE